MWMPAHYAESPGEAYWKMKLGSDISMPKVIKDALLGTKSNNNDEVNNGQVYAQEPSKVKTNRANQNLNNNNAAQAYAQQLSETRTNRATKFYNNNAAQAYAHKLSGARTYSATKVYNTNNAAQAYAQKLSGIRTNAPIKIVYNSKGSKLLTDNSVIFFLQKDLVHPGSKMKLHFLMGAQEAKFMHLEAANSIPFSSTKLPEILQFFAVNPKSANAKIIEETITVCESKPIKGEEKSCETSLEAMINYAKSHVGNQVKALWTEVNKETEQEYEIESAKKIKNDKNLVCHKLVYPYAVFYCHTMSKTDAYEVSLIDATKKKIRAVAVCHKDTSPWNPGHIAFQLLKVKPGSVPICHFLNADAMIWVPK